MRDPGQARREHILPLLQSTSDSSKHHSFTEFTMGQDFFLEKKKRQTLIPYFSCGESSFLEQRKRNVVRPISIGSFAKNSFDGFSAPLTDQSILTRFNVPERELSSPCLFYPTTCSSIPNFG